VNIQGRRKSSQHFISLRTKKKSKWDVGLTSTQPRIQHNDVQDNKYEYGIILCYDFCDLIF